MISIIVPVYNEEDTLDDFISFLKKAISNKEAELIFVDGGSTDKTFEKCKKRGFQVVRSNEKGRAAQMNAGASKAKGDVFYFLHADSIPPLNFIDEINAHVKKGYPAGCYRLSFDANYTLLNLYAWFTKFDITLFRFGDQSLYIKKNLFYDIGGFDKQLKVMEDQQIVREIKKRENFVILENTVTTSARKYERIGVLKLQAIFTVIVVLYYLKIDQEVIVDFYSNQVNGSVTKL